MSKNIHSSNVLNQGQQKKCNIIFVCQPDQVTD